MYKYFLDWKEVHDFWTEAPYIWIDVSILIEETVGEILGGDYTLSLDEMDPWESMKKKLKNKKVREEKIESLLEVIVSVKGEEKRISKKKNISTKISIDDIQKTLDKYSKNKVHVKAEIKER